jgi:hypothetical protein
MCDPRFKQVSARVSANGQVPPRRVFAVLRLITSSYLFGTCPHHQKSGASQGKIQDFFKTAPDEELCDLSR